MQGYPLCGHGKRLTPSGRSCSVAELDLAFDKKSLRQLCERKSKAERDLPAGVARQLWARLADLHAASCVTDLVAGRPRPLNGDNGRQMAVQLGQRRRLVFCANHNLVPATKLGGVDWSKVSRVKILRIEEDHE